MPRTQAGDGDEDEGDDFGGYESEYHPEADDAGELWCPKCGAVMYAGADLCPKCNEYVTPGAAPSKSMPVWMWIVGVAILLLILGAVVGAFFGAKGA
jgi:hypothetical protein